MSETKPTEIKKLKPGGFVLLDDVPCVVEKVQHSKSGKHGSAKARVFAKGIFEETKKIIVKPGDSSVNVPMIEKLGAQVIALTPDHVQVMDSSTYETYELKIPEDLKGQLAEGDEVLIWRFDRFILIKGKKG